MSADDCSTCRRRERRRAERQRRPAEPGAMGSALSRQLAGLGRRAADGDTEPLVQLYRLGREIDVQLTAGVVAARAAGASWTTIGAELGMSRQAARQRWSAAVAAAGIVDGVA